MRPLELVLVLVCTAVSIRLTSTGRGASWIPAAVWLLAGLLLVQIVVEGWRWQIAPAYAAAILALVSAPGLAGFGTQALFLSAVAGIGLLAASIVFCLALPFVQPPHPHGQFEVGVTVLPVSVSRPPEAVADELQAAPFVRLWYPARPSSTDRSRPLRAYLENRIANQFRARPTERALPDAPVAASPGRFPVVIYFDGWPEDTINNVNLIVELVSHGFVVASVQYPDKPAGTSDAADTSLRAHLARDMIAYSSDIEFERSVALTHTRAQIHAQDAVAVLNTLATLDTDSSNRFAHRVDTQRAGTLGFSFGGGVAAEASRLDPRIKAVVNMDGRHWGEALHKGVERPYLFISEELQMPTAADLTSPDGAIRYEAMLDQVDYPNLDANMRAHGGVRISIAGTAHMNFTDVPLRSPIRRFTFGGTIDAHRAQEIIQTYVVEFFSRYLLSAEQPALSSAWAQYPETRVQVWPAAASP